MWDNLKKNSSAVLRIICEPKLCIKDLHEKRFYNRNTFVFASNTNPEKNVQSFGQYMHDAF